MSTQNLDRSTLDAKARDELQQIATAVGVTGVSRLKKAELVEKILGAASSNGGGNGEGDTGRKVRSRKVDDDIESLAAEQNALAADATEPEIRPVRRQAPAVSASATGSDSAGDSAQASSGATARINSKSSPSPRACSSGNCPSDISRAAAAIGIAAGSTTAPQPLSRQIRDKSSDRPSLTSIAAWTPAFALSHIASVTRGEKSKCLPRMLPPNSPVTRIWSPGRAPLRFHAL